MRRFFIKSDRKKINFVLSQILPNPASSEMNVEFSIPRAGIVKIELFDALGQRIFAPADEFFTAGNNRKKLDISALSNGIYLCRFTFGNVSKVLTICVAR